MNQINVSLQELLQLATQLRQLNGQLSGCLEEMSALMNHLESGWSSETSITIRSKFNALSPHFVQHAKVIDSYVGFLEKTAENYQMTEMALNRNAESFQ